MSQSLKVRSMALAAVASGAMLLSACSSSDTAASDDSPTTDAPVAASSDIDLTAINAASATVDAASSTLTGTAQEEWAMVKADLEKVVDASADMSSPEWTTLKADVATLDTTIKGDTTAGGPDFQSAWAIFTTEVAKIV